LAQVDSALARRLALLGPATLKTPRRRRCCGIQCALAPTHHNRQAVDHQVEDAIVRLRKTLTRHGDDVGAASIAQHLARNPRITKVPAGSTIWRILTRRGFTTAQPDSTPLQLDTPHRRRTQRTLAGRVPVPIISVHPISTDTLPDRIASAASFV
jgi:hypothetical protein